MGTYLRKTAPKSYDIHAVGFSSPELPEMDLRDESQVMSTIYRIRPDVIINAAAIGSVDFVEKHPQEGYAVNVRGVEYLLKAANLVQTRFFVHISSNAVFSGKKPPYQEIDLKDPIVPYGIQKAIADDIVSRSRTPHCIIRPILMYGWPERGRQNLATLCHHTLSQWRRFQAASDVITQPLYAEDCARIIWEMVANRHQGIYHVAGADTVSVYEFCVEIAKTFQLKERLIDKVELSDLRLGKRPGNTTFDTTKIWSMGMRTSGIMVGLASMIGERT